MNTCPVVCIILTYTCTLMIADTSTYPQSSPGSATDRLNFDPESMSSQCSQLYSSSVETTEQTDPGGCVALGVITDRFLAFADLITLCIFASFEKATGSVEVYVIVTKRRQALYFDRFKTFSSLLILSHLWQSHLRTRHEDYENYRTFHFDLYTTWTGITVLSICFSGCSKMLQTLVQMCCLVNCFLITRGTTIYFSQAYIRG